MRLVMVYNADGGLVNGALDLAHKWLSPATYPCRLCDVTYSTLGMKRQWRDYLAALPLPVAIHHRDDFAAAHPGARVPLPAILLDRDGALEPLVDADAFGRIGSLDQLIAALDRALADSIRTG